MAGPRTVPRRFVQPPQSRFLIAQARQEHGFGQGRHIAPSSPAIEALEDVPGLGFSARCYERLSQACFRPDVPTREANRLLELRDGLDIHSPLHVRYSESPSGNPEIRVKFGVASQHFGRALIIPRGEIVESQLGNRIGAKRLQFVGPLAIQDCFFGPKYVQ